MANVIDTLHPENALGDNLYPNILGENIPANAVTLAKLAQDVFNFFQAKVVAGSGIAVAPDGKTISVNNVPLTSLSQAVQSLLNLADAVLSGTITDPKVTTHGLESSSFDGSKYGYINNNDSKVYLKSEENDSTSSHAGLSKIELDGNKLVLDVEDHSSDKTFSVEIEDNICIIQSTITGDSQVTIQIDEDDIYVTRGNITWSIIDGFEFLNAVNKKSLYHLGAYDTVSRVNGITTITRQTGYVNENYIRKNGVLHDTTTVVNGCYLVTIRNSTGLLADNVYCNKTIPYEYNYYFDNTHYYVQSGNLYLFVLVGDVQNFLLQYKLATAYTETVIENRPLNTLDQNGSQWLRQEWEKGLNLLSGNETIENQLNSSLTYNNGLYTYYNASVSNSISFIKKTFKANTTYTISLQNISGSQTLKIGVIDLDKTTWLTTHNNTYITFNFASDKECYIAILDTTNRGTTTLNIMLNEGDHAYPYQEYNGAIVHQKQLDEGLENKVDKVDGKGLSTNDFTNQDKTNLDNVVSAISEASVDITSTTALKYSGVSDNLALPAKSQVEVKKVVANSYQYNQLVNESNIETGTENGVVATKNNGTLILNGTNNGVNDSNFTLIATNSYTSQNNIINGHKYLIGVVSKNVVGSILLYGQFQEGAYPNLFSSLTLNNTRQDFIRTCERDMQTLEMWVRVNKTNNNLLTNVEITTQLFDLTAMGIDTSDVDVAKAELLKRGIDINVYNEYSAGKLINTTLTKQVITSVNLWDEETEIGDIDNSTGANTSGSRLRSKNYIVCKPNTAYYFYVPSNTAHNIYFYDKDKNFIGVNSNDVTSFTTPSNCYYIRFRMSGAYGQTYNHDICINVSNTAVNGNYYPYSKTEYAVGFSGKSAGTAHDEQVGKTKTTRVGSVDLSTLNWTYVAQGNGWWQTTEISNIKYVSSNTQLGNILSANYTNRVATGFSTSVSGEMALDTSNLKINTGSSTTQPSGTLNYELATPTTSEADDLPIIAVDYCGSEEQIYTGCPATITENYDISVKDQVITNVQVDAKQEEEIKELKSGKQDKLVFTGAGQNIKTIGGFSLDGSGNISISADISHRYNIGLYDSSYMPIFIAFLTDAKQESYDPTPAKSEAINWIKTHWGHEPNSGIWYATDVTNDAGYYEAGAITQAYEGLIGVVYDESQGSGSETITAYFADGTTQQIALSDIGDTDQDNYFFRVF